MLTEPIVYQDDRVSADLVVSAANGPAEFRRARLRIDAGRHLDEDDISRYMLRLWAYPDLASVCVGMITLDGAAVTLDRDHPLTFNQYLDLPDPLVAQLEDAVYRLNPGWMLRPAEQVDDEKKGSAPNSGSA